MGGVVTDERANIIIRATQKNRMSYPVTNTVVG